MIFISYRISDSEDLVDRLDNDLTLEFGQAALFRDKSRLEGGDVWTEVLETNAKSRKVMLVVIGPTWQTAAAQDGDWKGSVRLMNPEDWVRKEITLALDAGNIVIPVLRNGAAMPTEGWLRNCGLDRLFSQQAIAIRSTDYHADLEKLIARLRSVLPDLPARSQEVPSVVIITRLLPPSPPEYFAEIEYSLTDTFIGRASELDLLDEWAKSTNPYLVVEGLGGLGKSALTWEWFHKRSGYSISNLAGRAWCDFYGNNASLANSLRNVIAYIFRSYPPPEYSIQELCKILLPELKKRPYLLVFDGFERVLAAYHRWDKAQQKDDQIDTARRACVDPRDAEVLKQLLHASPSKILISSRLVPSALEDRTGRLCRGVAHHHLNGLSRADTLAYFRHVGIRGNESLMLDFAKKFGNHSLVLKVICGDICNYFRKPSDFDAWISDPLHGGRLKLSELDLKQNYTHILHFAMSGLDDPKQKLLSRLAILSEGMDYDTIFVLNPYLPERPSGLSSRDWVNSRPVQEARQQFDKALRELSDRGLVQWDRQTGRFDMHPVVRGHAVDLIPDIDRKTTFLAVRDHFQAMPEENHKEASELSQVRQSIEIYKSCLGAGLWEEAARFFKQGEFSNTLLFRIAAFPLVEELLKPLLEEDMAGQPRLKDVSYRSLILNNLAIAVGSLGRETDSLKLHKKTLRLDIDQKNWHNVAVALQNWSTKSYDLNQRAVACRTLAFSKEISAKVDSYDAVSCCILDEAHFAIREGRFTEAKQLLQDFRERSIPRYNLYRPGRAERYHCFNLFQQGLWSEPEWQKAQEIARESKNIIDQHRLLALRGEWLIGQGQTEDALRDLDEALKLANRSGMPVPDYHDLRGWALALNGCSEEVFEELDLGEQYEVAGQAWRILGENEKAKECALRGYQHAWGEGPPYILWYRLEQSRKLLRELGIDVPHLPSVDPTKMPAIPFEAELRALLPSIQPSFADLIYLIRGGDSTGRAAWYYVEVDREKKAQFEHDAKQGQIQLTEYGKIIISGYGEEPPQSVRKRMKDEYGFEE